MRSLNLIFPKISLNMHNSVRLGRQIACALSEQMQKKRTIPGLHVKEEEKDSDYQKL